LLSILLLLVVVAAVLAVAGREVVERVVAFLLD
jgi:hypothetical protein